jgi:hypothetical protein
MIYCNERVALRRVGRYQKADNTMARRKRTNNDLQNTTQKNKDRAILTW